MEHDKPGGLPPDTVTLAVTKTSVAQDIRVLQAATVPELQRVGYDQDRILIIVEADYALSMRDRIEALGIQGLEVKQVGEAIHDTVE